MTYRDKYPVGSDEFTEGVLAEAREDSEVGSQLIIESAKRIAKARQKLKRKTKNG